MIDVYVIGWLSLLEVLYLLLDLFVVCVELVVIECEVGYDDLLGEYLCCIVELWWIVVEMFEVVGMVGVIVLLIVLYGYLGDFIFGSSKSNFDVVCYFVELVDELGVDLLVDDVVVDIFVEVLCVDLVQMLDSFFGFGLIVVEVDVEFIVKVVVGVICICLCGGIVFSDYDCYQFFVYEVFVYLLIVFNGCVQLLFVLLVCILLWVIVIQEGLVVFVELMFGVIDILCFKWISLCILVIDMVLCGVDFVEVYWFFLECGQSVVDSFYLVQWVFCGVLLIGGVVFVKDNVYLVGLLVVYMFFCWVLKQWWMDLLCYLFVGKLMLYDVVVLELYFVFGVIVLLCWLLLWMQYVYGLVGKFVFLLFVNCIYMGWVQVEEFLLGL